MLLNDTEAKVDLLNFTATANAVAAMIRSSEDDPLSIGVFGDWGSGKSSLIRMIKNSLANGEGGANYLFIDFNAWLYQGFDDAKMALLQRVSEVLEAKVKDNQSLYEKIKVLFRRINFLRAAKVLLPVIGGAVTGGSLGGPLGAIAGFAAGIAKADLKSVIVNSEAGLEATDQIIDSTKSVVQAGQGESVSKEITELRNDFGELLDDIGIRLVVLVDDLDRCLPDVAVSTLEAMRLLLFTKKTVFIIAADKEAIKNAVRIRYAINDMEDKLVSNYFDKLVQIPVAVPHPSHNEIRCYLTALLTATAVLSQKVSKEEFQKGCGNLAKLLSDSWLGKVTTKEIDQAFGESAEKLRTEIDLADQMVSVMATADALSGNPRLMKRFVNAAVIRREVAISQRVECPLDALLKLMLLERCAQTDLFAKIHREVLESDEGVSKTIREWENGARPVENGVNGGKSDVNWIVQWVSLPPRFSDMDLRPLMYYSREVASWNYSVTDELSKNACEILGALLRADSEVRMLETRIQKLIAEDEATLMLRKLMAKAASKNWPQGMLNAALTIPQALPGVQKEYVRYLAEVIPHDLIPVSIVPIISRWTSACDALTAIKNAKDAPPSLKRAIELNLKGVGG